MKIDRSKYFESDFVFGVDNIDWNYMANIKAHLHIIDCILFDEQNYPLKGSSYISDKHTYELTWKIRKDLI
jgi:hypothetical protein